MSCLVLSVCRWLLRDPRTGQAGEQQQRHNSGDSAGEQWHAYAGQNNLNHLVSPATWHFVDSKTIKYQRGIKTAHRVVVAVVLYLRCKSSWSSVHIGAACLIAPSSRPTRSSWSLRTLPSLHLRNGVKAADELLVVDCISVCG